MAKHTIHNIKEQFI